MGKNWFDLLHLTVGDGLLAVETLVGGGRCVDVQDRLLAQSHQVGQSPNFVVKHSFSVPAIFGCLEASVGEETSVRQTRITRWDAWRPGEAVGHLGSMGGVWSRAR